MSLLETPSIRHTLNQWRQWGFKGKCHSTIARYMQCANSSSSNSAKATNPAHPGPTKNNKYNKRNENYLSTASSKRKRGQERRHKVQTTLFGALAAAHNCGAYGHILGPKELQMFRLIGGNINNLFDKHFFGKSSCVISFIRESDADVAGLAEMGRNWSKARPSGQWRARFPRSM